MKQNNSVEKKSKKSGRFGKTVIFLVIASLIAAGIYFVQSGQGGDESESDTGGRSERLPVVVTKPVRRTFEQVVVTQGNVEAKNVAMVSPRIRGTIEDIFVDEGDNVIAGRTKLFQTDSVKLQQNVTISEHNLAVARCALQQAGASLEKVTADFEKAELDFKRFERLLAKEATTQDAFEQQQSRYKQVAAARKLSQAQVELATEQVRQAEAALIIARKDLADTAVFAPISGEVSMRTAEPGEAGEPGRPILRIEDRSLVEVSVFLPAVYYPAVVTGKTQMKVDVSGIDLGLQTISYKSPTIDSRLRTFEVKCLLKDPPEEVAPGAMARIVGVLESREALGVPSAAIEHRGGQSVVFVVRDNVSHQVIIQPGIETDGWTEIRQGELNEQSDVVTMGQYMIEEGTKVSVQKEDK